MSLMLEYIQKRMSVIDLQKELQRLIIEYNKDRKTYLFVYSVALEKQTPKLALEQADYFIIHDLLSMVSNEKNLDFYIETPGGSAEAAEEIVNCLRNKFEKVSFVISGEAKSAGTILVLSGDEILMTETGSLGPIDAQMKIGRSIISAYDYIEWVDEKRKEAEKNNSLNPFDAVMIAQITPGEIGTVDNSLKYAQDLVEAWIPKYKFKNWNETETSHKPVTESMKIERAKEISSELVKHKKWRSHGRSLKIGDLEQIGLKIINIDDNKKLADIVYRIQTVCRLLFDGSTTFKIFATKDKRISKNAVEGGSPIKIPAKTQVDAAQVDTVCPKCGAKHLLYVKFSSNNQIDLNMKKNGFKEIPKNKKLLCTCGFEIEMTGILNQIEISTGKKIML